MKYDLADAKRRNERASVTLLREHLLSIGVGLGELRPGDAANSEPDAVCDSPEGPRGLEATNAFYDQEFAAWTWGTAIEAEGGNAPRRPRGEPVMVRGVKIGETSPVLVNPHLKLADAAQALLDQKCAKLYSVPTYLILDARHAGIVTADEGPSVVARLKMPEDRPLVVHRLLLVRGHQDSTADLVLGALGIFSVLPLRSVLVPADIGGLTRIDLILAFGIGLLVLAPLLRYAETVVGRRRPPSDRRSS